jgi:hypothetical protein
MSGQAASYYNPNQAFEQPRPAYQNPQPGYQNGFQQSPAQYQYNNGNGPEPKPPQEAPPTYNQAVYGFDDAFKIEKPKFHDLWAGLLVSFLPKCTGQC